MKLRIKGNNLRLRLTRGEVQRLATVGSLGETMQMAGAELSYRLRGDAKVTAPRANFSDSVLTVALPAQRIQSWAGSDEVSISGQHGPLKILVEKDFACLSPRVGEDDADAYPHPGQTAS